MLPAWDGADSDEHRLVHERLTSGDFAAKRFVRNPKFLMWLMGFPENHFDE